MSIHRSLRQTGGKTGTFRNVLKRHERLRGLMSRGKWTAEQSVFGLPKTKAERVKVRKAAPKETTAEKDATAPAEPAATKTPPAS